MAEIDRIYGLLLLVAALFATDAFAQWHAVPLSGAGTVYEMEGYSVLSPQGPDWFELKRDKRNVYFGKKIASRTHSFIATAISTPSAGKFSTADELRDYIGKRLPLRGDERHTVIENQAAIDSTLGDFCVRHYTKAADRNAIFAQGHILLAETFGVSCLHPNNQSLMIEVSYTERSIASEASAALRAEGETFVRSFKLIPR